MGLGVKTRVAQVIRDFMYDANHTEPALEAVFQRLVERELSRLGILDDFFPVGGAANYGLLYLILRIGSELKPARVLDVGAGQTTIMWHRLREIGLVRDIVTLEHNADWATLIASKVSHTVIASTLRTAVVEGRSIQTYGWEEAIPHGPFNAVTCDGPVGTPRFSRLGILRAVAHLATDYVLVLDDAERPGERDTVSALRTALPGSSRGSVNAAKRQDIFAGGGFARAAYFGASYPPAA